MSKGTLRYGNKSLPKTRWWNHWIKAFLTWSMVVSDSLDYYKLLSVLVLRINAHMLV